MGKKNIDDILEEMQRLKREVIFKQVANAIRSRPDDIVAALEEIGFTYCDDDTEMEEALEEERARPQNDNQEGLVACFEGKNEPTEAHLAMFLSERDNEQPNHPLIRRYFKAGNPRLKELILMGLERDPADMDLLSDLTFFHTFHNILDTLIQCYTRACIHHRDMATFSELVLDFYYATNPDGYEAFYALRELFDSDSEKRKIIDALMADEESAEKAAADISFSHNPEKGLLH